MSLIEEALKRAKRDGLTPDASRSRPMPPLAPRVVEPAIPPAGRLTARLASRPQLKIDREMLRAAGLAPLPSAERRLTSEYRALKRGLLAFIQRMSAVCLHGVACGAYAVRRRFGDRLPHFLFDLGLVRRGHDKSLRSVHVPGGR